MAYRESGSAERTSAAVGTTGAQTSVIMAEGDYDAWRQGRGLTDVLRATGRQPSGVAPDPSLVMLLPGPYEACVAPAIIAGALAVGGTPRVFGEARR